ncbi:unnamed protein product, partial [Prunus brigantina]
RQSTSSPAPSSQDSLSAIPHPQGFSSECQWLVLVNKHIIRIKICFHRHLLVLDWVNEI